MVGKFNFTWGMAQELLNKMGYLQVTGFMIDAYKELGLTRNEFLCILHLARFHYNSPQGEARPSAATIAKAMGYNHPNSVRNIVQSLEKKGMLLVTRQEGRASIYDASPFAHAAFRICQETLTSQCEGQDETLTSQCEGTLTSQCETPSHPSVTEENKKEKRGEEKELVTSFTITHRGIKVEH